MLREIFSKRKEIFYNVRKAFTIVLKNVCKISKEKKYFRLRIDY